MKKLIKNFLGMREKGNPYGCRFFANIGCFSFVILILILVASPTLMCTFSMSTEDWCSETKINKWNAYFLNKELVYPLI